MMLELAYKNLCGVIVRLVTVNLERLIEIIYFNLKFYNYFLYIILILNENDLLSPSTLKGYAVCIK